MRFRIVDAFTDRPFAGNPAGVLVLNSPRFPDDRWLQRVAAEVNHAETAFVAPLPDDPDADWALRWFTPTTEVRLCGHATLAAAHIVGVPARFRTLHSGVLTAGSAGDGAITLDFPAAPLTRTAVHANIAPAIGTEPLSVHETGENVGDLLVEVADEKTVRDLEPDMAAVAGLASRRGLIVTAPAEDPSRGYDFVTRCFFPGLGIPEDPVTGSAHTALSPFWSARLGREDLSGLQASARTGLVRTALRGDRVLLTGTAVTVIDGELHA
jgi:PhzF family phenazine biosynthesis protein